MAASLFGTAAVAAQLLDADAPPVTIAALRASTGGAALLVVATMAGVAPWRFPRRVAPTVIGAGAVVAFQLGYFAAVDRAGASTATMVTIGVGPVAAGVLEVLTVRRRPSARWTGGVAMAVAGIACIGGTTSTLDVAAIVLCVAAGACFPVYGECIRRLTSDRPPLAAAATVFGAAALPTALLAASDGAEVARSVPGATLVAYLGLVTVALAYALWARGIRTVPLSVAVAITMVEPITALALAAVLLGEIPGPLGVVGAATVLAGIVVASSGVVADPATIPTRRRGPADANLARSPLAEEDHHAARRRHGTRRAPVRRVDRRRPSLPGGRRRDRARAPRRPLRRV